MRWKPAHGSIGRTFGNFYIWGDARWTLLIDPEQFWLLAEALLIEREGKLFAQAQRYLKRVGGMIASDAKDKVERQFCQRMSTLLHKVHETKAGRERFMDAEVPSHWVFEAEQGDQTWMAALDWFGSRHRTFAFYKVRDPEDGVALVFKGIYGATAFDGSDAIFLSISWIDRVWAYPDQLFLIGHDSQVLEIQPWPMCFKRRELSELPREILQNLNDRRFKTL